MAQRKKGSGKGTRSRSRKGGTQAQATARAARSGRRAARPAGAPDAATFYVCRSCVWSEAARERDGKRQGTFLLEAVQALIEAEPLPAALKLRAVYCLNGCKSPCNVGFRAAGKHHVRFSHLTPENAADVLAYARAYRASTDGDVREEETPQAMRGKMTVRTPPVG